MMHSWKSVLATAIISAIAFGAGGARDGAAALVTYNFTGTLDGASAGLTSQFGAGNTLSGSFTFESTTPALGGSTATTAVFNALTSLNFALNGYTASTTGAPEVQTGNKNGTTELTDRFATVSRNTDGLAGANVNGFALQAFILRLDDSTGSVFSSALTLPTNASFANFDATSFFVFFSGGQLANGHLTSFGLAGVPEPATLVLLGVALLGLGALARYRGRMA